MTDTLTFRDFAHGPGGHIARRIGIPIRRYRTWRDAQDGFRSLFDGSDSGSVMQRVRNEIYKMSTGEIAVACALLHALDYSWLADEMDGGRAWRRLDNVYGDHRRAVLAAILRQDEDVAHA